MRERNFYTILLDKKRISIRNIRIYYHCFQIRNLFIYVADKHLELNRECLIDEVKNQVLFCKYTRTLYSKTFVSNSFGFIRY